MVVGLSQKDLQDLFEVRWTLESKAIETIVKEGSNRNLSRIDLLLREMRTERDFSTLIELDIEFHYRLVESSQNRTLIKLWSVMRDLISTLIEISSDFYERLEQVTEVHADLLGAVEEGRADRAIEILREHLDTGEALISEHLSKLSRKRS
jgi:DNA-binding FadR family transcriptional regulator